MKRHQFIRTSLLSLPCLAVPFARSQDGAVALGLENSFAPGEESLEEYQAGDPLQEGEKFEELLLTKQQQNSSIRGTVHEKRSAEKLALQMLKISQGYADAHVSRTRNNGEEVKEFLKLLGFGLRYGGPMSAYVPYCAAGVTYAACRSYCDLDPKIKYSLDSTDARINTLRSYMPTINAHYFVPSASVRVIKNGSVESQKNWKAANTDPKPGWLVIFSWSGGVAGNHIGIVESSTASELFTVEYNTALTVGNQRDGGVVARKKRPRDGTVLGFVALY